MDGKVDLLLQNSASLMKMKLFDEIVISEKIRGGKLSPAEGEMHSDTLVERRMHDSVEICD